jgi:hypothetical protein
MKNIIPTSITIIQLLLAIGCAGERKYAGIIAA